MGWMAGHSLGMELFQVDLKWGGEKVHRAARPGEMMVCKSLEK